MTCILTGRNDRTGVDLDLRRGNRCSMIAGVTGTGTSVSLVVLAGGRPKRSAPGSLADAKGELAGLTAPCTTRRSAPGAARA